MSYLKEAPPSPPDLRIWGILLLKGIYNQDWVKGSFKRDYGKG